MIAIKTQMQRMPKWCGECRCLRTEFGKGYLACIGDVEFGFVGRAFEPEIRYPRRPNWCPLVEVEVKGE